MTAWVSRLEGVVVEYRDVPNPVRALNGVTHAFEAGSSTAIIGRSGSGKSTLVAVLALLRRPTAGKLFFDDLSVQELSDRGLAVLRRKIGIVFQSFHVDERTTVLSNVLFPNHWSARPRAEAMKRAMEALELLGIAELRNRKVAAISGGQRQRVAIARALVERPTLLIADEPTGNLDELTADHVARDLFSVAKELSATLVVATHDPNIASLAGKTLRMISGELSEEPS